jgi:hypothetical protein
MAIESIETAIAKFIGVMITEKTTTVVARAALAIAARTLTCA